VEGDDRDPACAQVQLERKVERIAAYLRFQSSQKLRRFFENWVGRHLAGAWAKWTRMVGAVDST
jgi:hypothetical protein